jgi:hypothetical protein
VSGRLLLRIVAGDAGRCSATAGLSSVVRSPSEVVASAASTIDWGFTVSGAPDSKKSEEEIKMGATPSGRTTHSSWSGTATGKQARGISSLRTCRYTAVPPPLTGVVGVVVGCRLAAGLVPTPMGGRRHSSVCPHGLRGESGHAVAAWFGLFGSLSDAGCDASGGITKQSPQYLGYTICSCRCHDFAMGGLAVVWLRLLRPAAGAAELVLSWTSRRCLLLVTAVS